MVESHPELYPREYQNIFGPSRSWDSSHRLHLRENTPRVPPTTLQISVLDIEPSVWSTAFKPPPLTAQTRKHSSSRNFGEMSHAEVARRTEAAIKRNAVRQAEKEERRLKLKEARENRNQPPPPPLKKVRKKRKNLEVPSPAPPTPKRAAKAPKTPKQRPRPAVSPAEASPRIGPKSVMQKYRGSTPPRARSPASPSSSGRSSRAAKSPPAAAVASPAKTATPKPSSSRGGGIRRKLHKEILAEELPAPAENEAYDSRVFRSVSEEIANCLDMSPTKNTMITGILQPKIAEAQARRLLENSYETSVVNHLKTEVPALWRNKYPYDDTVLSRRMCDHALKTFQTSNFDQISSSSKCVRKSARGKSRGESNIESEAAAAATEPAEATAVFTPAFNRVTFGQTRKNGFHQSQQKSPELGPKNLRRLSKDFSPQKAYV